MTSINTHSDLIRTQVGAEGAIEVALCLMVILPIVGTLPGDDHGRVEDQGDTLQLLATNPRLRILFALFFVSLASLNPVSMAIGQRGGSVLRVLIREHDYKRFACKQHITLTENNLQPN